MKTKLTIVISGILIGLIGVTVKSVISDMHPLTINFFRILFAFIFLLIFIPFIDKTTFKVKLKDFPHYILAGLLLSITFATYILALNYAPVSNVVLIASFAVVFVAIFAFIFLKEKLKFNQKIAIVIAIIGLSIINPFNFNSTFFIGNLIALFNGVAYALLLVFMRSEERTHTIGSILWFFLFATIFSLPFLFVGGIGDNFSKVLPFLVVLGVASTAIPYTLLAIAIKRLHVDTISIINTLTVPLSSILFAVILLNEILNIRLIIGGSILLISGVVLHYIRKKHIKIIREQLHL
ncbi:DMT family transporter [Candidatus Woesearchaeota archaeon]|jgi:drug/metabolite transporter (DMT)-like permease|nr:DMT family transporter [Candidatus Woesearchaeota archaeon]MBT4322136.1 DMT family transporter [Candidatus Woesearchaeota archaeon]MBT4630972.1 DMT family transporter [Candidatus Woesearchaeota archaeon]